MRIGLATKAWKAFVLPLNYTRIKSAIIFTSMGNFLMNIIANISTIVKVFLYFC